MRDCSYATSLSPHYRHLCPWFNRRTGSIRWSSSIPPGTAAANRQLRGAGGRYAADSRGLSAAPFCAGSANNLPMRAGQSMLRRIFESAEKVLQYTLRHCLPAWPAPPGRLPGRGAVQATAAPGSFHRPESAAGKGYSPGRCSGTPVSLHNSRRRSTCTPLPAPFRTPD